MCCRQCRDLNLNFNRIIIMIYWSRRAKSNKIRMIKRKTIKQALFHPQIFQGIFLTSFRFVSMGLYVAWMWSAFSVALVRITLTLIFAHFDPKSESQKRRSRIIFNYGFQFFLPPGENVPFTCEIFCPHKSDIQTVPNKSLIIQRQKTSI